jgi:NAD(P)-dependent dehydrogenase (short-subunit alcohol dehydrogenase family)
VPSDGVALVVGAAGDIGRATCHRLRALGLAVAGWDIQGRQPDVDLAAWTVVDLADGEVPDALPERLAELGPLRFVFHVVGGADLEEAGQPDPARVPMAAIRRTVSLNLLSAYGVVRATVPLLRTSSGDRSYTLVSSLNAYGGYGLPGYSGAKAGLHGLVRALAAPLGRDGIRINAVALGTTHTANFERVALSAGHPADFARLGRQLPRGRVLEPAEAAATLVSIGVDNPAVSGAVVIADGGQSVLRASPDNGA